LPEVASQASWSIFFALLAGLIVLLFVPGVIARFMDLKSAIGSRTAAPKPKPQIKLK
jgi:hypothetical protein